ncbi:ankyrin repeat-containing domain protein, partial [Baffinella frigidus]
LLTAARWGHFEEVRMFLKRGEDIEQRGGSFDRPALFEAVMCNHYDVALMLLENGANVMSLDDGLWTPLHVAAHHNSMECASLLLDYGAD